MIYTLKNETLCALVSDTGAELISVTKDGKEYIWQGEAPYWRGHSPILFPICGRILDGKYLSDGKEYFMNSHGFARASQFTLVSHSENSLVLSLSSSKETLDVYPFEFTLTAEFSISQSQLDLTITVENKNHMVMPYMLGWHPGFNLHGDKEISEFSLDFHGKESLTLHPLQHGCFVRPYGEKYELNNGKLYLNEEEIYKIDTLIFTDSNCSVSLLSAENQEIAKINYSRNIPYFCVWKTPDSSARFICLEPWSAVPSDGECEENFDTRKMTRLSPMESEKFEFRVEFN